MQFMQNAMRELQVWNQLLVMCLNTITQPTGGIPCISVTMYSDNPHPLSNHPTRVPIKQAWAEEPKNILIFCENGPVGFWSTPKKFLDPPPDNPPTPSDSTHLYTNRFDVRIPNI